MFSRFLAIVGKRFHIDAGYFAKNVLFVMSCQVVNIMKGLVIGYLVTRMFPPKLFGEYKFVTSLVGAIGVIGLSGIGAALSREIAREGDNAPVRHGMFLYTIFCLIEFTLTLGIIPFLYRWNQQDLWPLFVIAATFSLPFNVGATFFGSIVTGEGKFKKSLQANIIINSCVMASVLLMLLVRPSSTLLLALTIGIPGCVFFWMSLGMIKRYRSKKKSWDVFRYALRMTIADLPMGLASYMDDLIVSAFFGLNQLALFSVAQMIPNQVKLLFKDFLPIAFSRQAAGNDSRQRTIHLFKMTGILMLIFGGGIACYILLAPWILPILFPQYDASQLILLTSMSALFTLTAPASLFTQHLGARGMARELRNTQWFSSAIFCLALLVFVPTLGLPGALLARGAFRIVLTGYSGILVWKSASSEKLPAAL